MIGTLRRTPFCSAAEGFTKNSVGFVLQKMRKIDKRVRLSMSAKGSATFVLKANPSKTPAKGDVLRQRRHEHDV